MDRNGEMDPSSGGQWHQGWKTQSMFGKHFNQNLHYLWKVMKEKLRSGKLRLYCGAIGSRVCIELCCPWEDHYRPLVVQAIQWNFILGILNWLGLYDELDQGETGSRKTDLGNYFSDIGEWV